MAKAKKKAKKEAAPSPDEVKAQFLDLMEQLDKAYYAAKDDIDKVSKGVAKAGRRLRNNLMEVRNITKEIRKASITLTRKPKKE